MKKYTKYNNVLIASIAFMNETNYQNAFQGLPVVIKGLTGQLVKEKKQKAINDGRSKAKMKQLWGAKHYNKGKLNG